MSWNALQLCTDQDIGALEPEATDPSRPWKFASWAKQRTEAKRDLRIWLETDFAEIPGVADRVLDRWKPEYLFTYTAGVYSDKTSELSDDEEEDVNLATVFATAGTDRICIGASWEFEGLFIKLLDSVNTTASVLTAKYWGKNQWTAVPSQSDGTIQATGKTLGQSGRISWVLPVDWERRTLNGTGDEYYWIELSVSVTPLSTTTVTQILPIHAPQGLKRVAGYLACYHIFKGLAAGAANPESWLTRSKEYMDQARELYAILREKGGIPLDVNHTGAIEPTTETPQTRPGVTLGRA